MDVRVTKFDRFIDTAKVCVGFYVTHPSVDTGLYVDQTVDMQGTDANMIENAWIELLPRVTKWAKDEQAKASATIGSSFTVPIVMVSVPTESPTGPTQ